MQNHNPFDADATADYGSILSDGWTLYDWEQWYYANKRKYGAPIAKQKFVRAWENHSFFSSFEFGTYSFAKYDRQFNKFLKDEGLDLSNFIADVVTDTGEIVTNVTDTAKRTTATASYILPVVLIGAVILVGLMAMQKAKAV